MYLVKFLLFAAIISQVLGAFGHFPFGSSSASFYLGDIFLVSSLLFLTIWKVSTKSGVLFPKFFKWLVPFWIAGIISLIGSVFLFPLSAVFAGSLYLIRFILYSLVYLVSYNLYKSGILKTEELVNMWIRVGIAVAFLGFLQFIFFPDLEFLSGYGFDPHKNRLTSTLLDPNFVGVVLNLTLGLCLYKFFKGRDRLLWLCTCGLFSLAIVMTFSRSAYLMLFVSILYMSLRKFKKLLLVLLGVGLVLFILYPKFTSRIQGALSFDKTSRERVISWQKGAEIFKLNPIIGVGFNNAKEAQEKLNLFPVFSAAGGHAGGGLDSSLILVLATTGVVGLVVYLLFWIRILGEYIRKSDVLSVVISGLILGLLVNSQFINSLFFTTVMLWYFSILGVV